MPAAMTATPCRCSVRRRSCCATSWSGTVQLIFQPSEENGAGARAMIADGLLERFPMERVFGFHNWPGLEAGTVQVHRGPVMADPGRFEITLHGTAGHGAKPDLTRDPIVAAGHPGRRAADHRLPQCRADRQRRRLGRGDPWWHGA